jgi:hypothetical protein
MEVTTLGIDLGKNVFHVVGLDARGRAAVKRRVSRSQLIGTEAIRIISRSSAETCRFLAAGCGQAVGRWLDRIRGQEGARSRRRAVGVSRASPWSSTRADRPLQVRHLFRRAPLAKAPSQTNLR